jgi:hypothetical protein
MPPVESPYFNEDSFSILEREINHFQAQVHVLVCGALNGRIGQEPDTLSTQETNTYLEVTVFPPKYAPHRHNYDKTTNKNGSKLLQLCHKLGLYIVNGRLRGDSYGRYTDSSSLGSSYCILLHH